MSVSTIDPTMPVFHMRQGDRLPLLALVVEDDDGNPVDLTGARAWVLFRPLDGEPVFTDGTVTGWYTVEAMIPSPAAGVVAYDWLQPEVDSLNIAVYELAVAVEYPGVAGRFIAPTSRRSQLVVRPGFT
jgi:hypothetical protein